MKKAISIVLLAAMLCLLAGCGNPNSLQMDLTQGFGEEIKLLHLNASSKAKQERILAFRAALDDPQPLDKDISLFAYYPDYRLEIRPAGGESVSAVIDINGDYVDFICPNDDRPEQIYRSRLSAREFKKLVNQF